MAFKAVAELFSGIDEVSLPTESKLGEIVIETTCGCEHAMANVDSITVVPSGRYAGGSHIILSSSHITHIEFLLRPMPRRTIEASPAGRDLESFDTTASVRVHVHVSIVHR